jgi:hypothetical protein
MADLSKVLNETVGIDEEQFKEMITQNSLFQNVYKLDAKFASDFDDEDADDDADDDDFEEEDEDLFDEDELEEEGYEEDFDFDEEEEEEDDEENLGKYN